MSEEKILLDHGSGGKISHSMFSEMILPLFDNPELAKQDDGATLDFGGTKLAFVTKTGQINFEKIKMLPSGYSKHVFECETGQQF